MSRSLVDLRHRPQTTIANRLKGARRAQQRKKTLQLQGNQSLGLGVLEGYFAITIPTTIEPSVAAIDVVAPTGTTILIGNLMHSLYYRVADAGSPSGFVFENRDQAALYPTRLIWDCFFAYDARPKGSGTLASTQAVIDAGVPFTTARITASIRSNSSWSLPGGADSTLYVFYQVRATLM